MEALSVCPLFCDAQTQVIKTEGGRVVVVVRVAGMKVEGIVARNVATCTIIMLTSTRFVVCTISL